MNIARQIKIVTELLEASNELNGVYQDGWDAECENGGELLEHLTNKQIEDNKRSSVEGDVKPWRKLQGGRRWS